MKYCGKCNKPINIIEKIVSENETERIHEVTEQCDNCKIIYKKYNKKVIKPKAARKDSSMSVVAAILAFFGCTALFGFIFALVDLIINEKDKRHLGSWVAMVFCAMWLFVALVTSGHNAKEENSFANTTNETIETSMEIEQSESIVVETPASEEISEVEIAEVPAETEEEYKASCQEYNYKDVLRNPNDYVGQKIVIEMEISSVHSEDILTPVKYYFGYTKDEPDDTYYYGDFYAVFDKRYDTSLKLLDEDVIIVWGEISAPQETQSFIVNSEEVFCIDMKYVELIAE